MSLRPGAMKVGEKGRLIQFFGRMMAPFFGRVFPDIPAGHPASGSIVMNFSANILGLDNVATPLGLKEMGEPREIDPHNCGASHVKFQFTPISAYWLNQVEIWFGVFQRKRLNIARFEIIAQPNTTIHDFTVAYKVTAAPFASHNRARLRNSTSNLRNRILEPE